MNQRETVADRGLEFLGLRVHRTVFPLAVALIVLAVIAALIPGFIKALLQDHRR